MRSSRTYGHKSEVFCTQTGCPVMLRHSFWVRIPSSYCVKSVISIWARGGTARESYSSVKSSSHHHHHKSVMELGHLLTLSGLTYPEVSSKVYHDSFCQLGSRVSLPWVIYFEALYLHVLSSFSCIPVICPKLVLFLTHLQFVHLFCNLSKCILLFFSCILSLLLLFFWRPLF